MFQAILAQIRAIYKFLDALFFAVCGLTWIDLVTYNAFNLDSVDNTIKTLAALGGLIYFAISLPHRLKMNRLNRKIKEEELKKLEKENQ